MERKFEFIFWTIFGLGMGIVFSFVINDFLAVGVGIGLGIFIGISRFQLLKK